MKLSRILLFMAGMMLIACQSVSYKYPLCNVYAHNTITKAGNKAQIKYIKKNH